MFQSESNRKKELFRLREEKRDIKGRISQSMSDTGQYGVTGNCKKLQQSLAQIVKVEKRKKQNLRRR